jgi:hypothetical protein
MAVTFILATPMYEQSFPWFDDSMKATIRMPECIDWIYVDHLYVDHGREKLVEMSNDYNPDGILWVDSDMQWDIKDVQAVITPIDALSHIKCGVYPARKEDVVLYDGMGFCWTPMKCFDGPRPWFHTSLQITTGMKWIGEDKFFFALMHERGIQIDLYESDTLKHDHHPGPRSVKEMKERMK